jgi:predicted O-methyltransferase YrrM
MIAIKRFVASRLGDIALGWLDFMRLPERGRAWGGAFNGQNRRVALFHELMTAVKPKAIVETGTYLGTTTELFAQVGQPVFTIEGNARNYGFASARLRQYRNTVLLKGDSRAQLRELFKGALAPFAEGPLFFYLDAHWNNDLPLADELKIVFGECPNAVVMIDDFEVPGDIGFGYDDYGQGKGLVFSYIAPIVAMHQLAVFFPSTPSSEETGARRGCVVLCKSENFGPTLNQLPLLRASRCLDQPD